MRAVAMEMKSGQVNMKMRPKGFPGGLNTGCERWLKGFDLSKWKVKFC